MLRERKSQHNNKRAVEMISNTNKSLMSSLEALGFVDGDGSSQHFEAPLENGQRLLSPSASSNHGNTDQSDRLKLPPSQQEKQQNIANEKLRRSLLVVTREQNKLAKKNENLEETTYTLSRKLSLMEERCKALRNELKEYRFLSQDPVDETSKISSSISSDIAIKKPTAHKMRKLLPNVEERFLEQLQDQNLEPVETLLVLKNIIQVSTMVPDSLDERDIAAHFLLSNLTFLLDCEFMNIFILQACDRMLKYDRRLDPMPILCDQDGPTSIALDVLRSGDISRVDNTKSVKIRFNPSIDGHKEIFVRNLLSIPIKTADKGTTIGVLQMSNKQKGSKFTECDEILTAILALLMGTLFHTSMSYKRMSNKSELLLSHQRLRG